MEMDSQKQEIQTLMLLVWMEIRKIQLLPSL